MDLSGYQINGQMADAISERLKKQKKLMIYGISSLMVQVTLTIIFLNSYFKNFSFGVFLCIILVMIEKSVLLVSFSIKNDYVNIENDSGVFVWWLCCIRFGDRRSSNRSITRSKTMLGADHFDKPE